MEQTPRMGAEGGWEQKQGTAGRAPLLGWTQPFDFFRDKMEGSTGTDTDEHCDFGVMKTGENKTQDIYGGETSGGALDSWPSNWIEPEDDEELLDLGCGWLPGGGG